MSGIKFEEIKEILANSIKNNRKPKDHFIKTYLHLEVRNEDDETIAKRKYLSRSWVQPFAYVLYGLMNGSKPTVYGIPYKGNLNTGPVCAMSISSSTVYIGNLFNVLAPDGNGKYGIVAGTGTIPVSATGMLMQQWIDEGNIHYYGTTLSQLTPITGGYEFAVVRQISNKTQNPIQLTEFGLVAKPVLGYSGSCGGDPNADLYWMLLHDVRTSAPSIPSNSVLIVKYIFNFLV
ncbi:MAG: hypothetical protein CBR30_09725 [Dictyoglomus sp. NZ13-RE01]|nr:MAG: hypothetical protein CBR30_09725 [Dictyoglomus sp. NZ13-RE01]